MRFNGRATPLHRSGRQSCVAVTGRTPRFLDATSERQRMRPGRHDQRGMRIIDASGRVRQTKRRHLAGHSRHAHSSTKQRHTNCVRGGIIDMRVAIDGRSDGEAVSTVTVLLLSVFCFLCWQSVSLCVHHLRLLVVVVSEWVVPALVWPASTWAR